MYNIIAGYIHATYTYTSVLGPLVIMYNHIYNTISCMPIKCIHTYIHIHISVILMLFSVLQVYYARHFNNISASMDDIMS